MLKIDRVRLLTVFVTVAKPSEDLRLTNHNGGADPRFQDIEIVNQLLCLCHRLDQVSSLILHHLPKFPSQFTLFIYTCFDNLMYL